MPSEKYTGTFELFLAREEALNQPTAQLAAEVERRLEAAFAAPIGGAAVRVVHLKALDRTLSWDAALDVPRDIPSK